MGEVMGAPATSEFQRKGGKPFKRRRDDESATN